MDKIMIKIENIISLFLINKFMIATLVSLNIFK